MIRSIVLVGEGGYFGNMQILYLRYLGLKPVPIDDDRPQYLLVELPAVDRVVTSAVARYR